MEYILEVKNLTKKYGKKIVVDSVNLSVEKGHIYGLIGPNGAGKTTIMKIIAGLAAQDGGTVALFGSENNLDASRSRMSFMLEAPYLEKSMTARQNMEYIRYVRGVADEKRIEEMLDFVGLADVGKKKVGQFSLGMRQRLGIGMALLPGPELMILDEPVNGLDPEGIVEVRNILKKLAYEDGITILISSHLLAELSELCSDYAIINEGTILECLSAEELESKCRSYISIQTDNISESAAILEEQLATNNYKVIEHDEIHLFDYVDDVKKVSKTLTDSGMIITKLLVEGESLEEYYISKVGGKYE
ncbi:MAG: ATP-binding cassette domain-containing protein [Lachnospiraceae bacterium]|nr:ATP-binding cassette domain-containing protein [Lachnospiraceae bacterium]